MNIILAVTGGIAAYKACDLINILRRHGNDVRVIMTDNAKQFITPMTLSTLSKHPVMDNMWQEKQGTVDHIEVATWAQIFIVYPATANIIGKFANGIADDLLSTVYLALPVSVKRLVFPAMNTNMYNSAAVRRNIAQLGHDGCFISETRDGNLACGTKGAGCLVQPDKALEFFLRVMAETTL
jgi:phosphopantothenoylcysteine synthetase/decarboxylase